MNKARTFTSEFKLSCVRELLENNVPLKELGRRENINTHVIRRWRDNFLQYGEQYFFEEHRGKKKGKASGNPYAALHTKKNLSHEERLTLENLKLRIENERLKKGYTVKGVGANKAFVTTKDANMKS